MTSVAILISLVLQKETRVWSPSIEVRSIAKLQGFDLITKLQIDSLLKKAKVTDTRWMKSFSPGANMWVLVADPVRAEPIQSLLGVKWPADIDANAIRLAPPSAIDRFFSLPKNSFTWFYKYGKPTHMPKNQIVINSFKSCLAGRDYKDLLKLKKHELVKVAVSLRRVNRADNTKILAKDVFLHFSSANSEAVTLRYQIVGRHLIFAGMINTFPEAYLEKPRAQ